MSREVLVPFGTRVRHACQWCVIDGRCSNGKCVSYSTVGVHESDCPCMCHTKLSRKVQEAIDEASDDRP